MNKFKRFLQTRNGIDSLNKFLIILMVIIFLINLPTGGKNIVANVLYWLLVIIFLFRTFSGNIQKRYHENTVFEYITRPIKRKFKLFTKQIKDLKHKYIICPFCHQMIRLPRHKGEITVTCPKCQQKFDKRT
ncbi:MAG: hypothetical protein PHH04_00995 [Thomasclavelia sp.]|nr:hypothetical protein [Thomasclavelia sp.]